MDILVDTNILVRSVEPGGISARRTRRAQLRTAHLSARLEAIFHLLPETPEIFPEWKSLVGTNQTSGLKVYDTRLVAVMNVHGLKTVLTYNVRDFVRFSGISVLHPETIAPA